MNHDIKAKFKKPSGQEVYAIIPRGSVKTMAPFMIDCAKAEAFGINGVPMLFPNNDFKQRPTGINWERFEVKLAAVGATREEFEATVLLDKEPVNVGLPG